MKKKILFRADGNSSIGLGHLYRLFAIVEMIKQEYEFTYIVSSSSTISVIPNGYDFIQIPEKISIEEEPFWLSKQFKSDSYIIIADGYQFDSGYQKKIKELGFSLVYIDDLGTEHMYADVVVNHSPSLEVTNFKSEPYTKFALGTDYALLRPGFQKAASAFKEIRAIDTAFICFGGSDFHNLTYKCLEGMLKVKKIKEIHIVLGAAYKHQNILKVKPDNNTKLHIHRNLTELEMLRVMNQCHLGVIPSSTISYEACAVKMIIFGGYYVNNQINIYRGFQEKGIIYHGGDFTKYSIKDFEEQIVKIIEDSPDQHQQMLKNQSVFFDGKCKERLISLLKELT